MTSKHYKSTYARLLKELPKWKQLAVKEDSANNNWSGILTEFIKNVIVTAESEFERESLESLKFTDGDGEYKVSKKSKKKSKSLDKL